MKNIIDGKYCRPIDFFPLFLTKKVINLFQRKEREKIRVITERQNICFSVVDSCRRKSCPCPDLCEERVNFLLDYEQRSSREKQTGKEYSNDKSYYLGGEKLDNRGRCLPKNFP